MKKILTIVLMIFALGIFPMSGASATTFTMQEDAFNSDGGIGTFTTPYDFAAVTWNTSFNTPGPHFYIAFIDPEITETDNTFFNEYGAVVGTALPGQSWEIDEPGYLFGNIKTNFTAGLLDNLNGTLVNLISGETDSEGYPIPDYLKRANGILPAFLAPSQSHPDDVSMALGWNFFLDAGETAILNFYLSTTAPSRFYLAQIDDNSGDTLYFSSTLDIQGGNQVPEPGTLMLLAVGLFGIAGLRRKTTN